MTSEYSFPILGDKLTTEEGRVFERVRLGWGRSSDPTFGDFVWDKEALCWVETDAAFSARIRAAVRESKSWGDA